MKKFLSIVLMIIIIINGNMAFSDEELDIREGLRSYILGDLESGQVLEEYNISEVVELASISKIMSYIVIMDKINHGDISLYDNIIIDKDTTRIKGSSFKLRVGEEFEVGTLLEASMVVSGNDATYALAKHVAGTEEEFVALMNLKAKEIGLANAMFYNSTGLPIEGQDVQNKMTTEELFELTRYILKNYPEVIDITTIKFIDIPSREFFQRNTNPLLGEIQGVDGLKTGFTNKAGYCYISTFNIEGKHGETNDLKLIGIFMGAKDIVERNILARISVEDAINKYSSKILLDENTSQGEIEFPKGNIQTTEMFPEKGFSKLINNDDNITIDISIDENINLPVYENKEVGKIFVKKDGELLFETNLIIKENIVKAKWYILLGRLINQWIDKLFRL